MSLPTRLISPFRENAPRLRPAHLLVGLPLRLKGDTWGQITIALSVAPSRPFRVRRCEPPYQDRQTQIVQEAVAAEPALALDIMLDSLAGQLLHGAPSRPEERPRGEDGVRKCRSRGAATP